MVPERKPDRSADPEQSKTHSNALAQPQLGTTAGTSVNSQTGSAGSESGGAQFGTSESAAKAPQTGAGTSQTGDAQLGANKPSSARNREAHEKPRQGSAGRPRRN